MEKEKGERVVVDGCISILLIITEFCKKPLDHNQGQGQGSLAADWLGTCGSCIQWGLGVV